VPIPITLNREAARRTYEALRETNPHLPPADLVGAAGAIKLTFGPEQMTTLSLEVFVEVPESWWADE
jgi:hypothetical protein